MRTAFVGNYSQLIGPFGKTSLADRIKSGAILNHSIWRCTLTQGSDQAMPRLVWSEHFAGGGQGTFRFEVTEAAGQFQLTVRNEYLLNQEWTLPMRNAGEFDIALAAENFKTLMWRCGLWFLRSLVDSVNLRLENAPVEGPQGLRWLRYSLHQVKESPFDDPELNSPIAVIDLHHSPVSLSGKPHLAPTEWIQEPWAAVFLHDGTLLSCLPENEELYYPLRDVMDLVFEFCADCHVDQADFLGRVHAKYKPAAHWLDFDFLKTWGLN